MELDSIYQKTPQGTSEMNNQGSTLSVMERRVLILINGKKDVQTLEKQSLCKEVDRVIKKLIDLQFIELPATDKKPEASVATKDSTQDRTAEEPDAREFMVNTLLTFSNRVRTKGLIEDINNALDMEQLKQQIQPWYRAISETPNGMYQADDLKTRIQEMILAAEA